MREAAKRMIRSLLALSVRQKALTLLLLVGNVALLGSTLSHVTRQALTPTISEATLAYDSVIDQSALIAVRDVTGGAATVMLLFLTGAEPDSLLRFFDLLAERYHSQAFRIIGMTPNDAIATKVHARATHMATLVDDSLHLHRALNVPVGHNHGGVAVIRLPGRLLFRALSLDSEDALRQLAEKHSLGVVDYTGSTDLIEPLLTIGSSGTRQRACHPRRRRCR